MSNFEKQIKSASAVSKKAAIREIYGNDVHLFFRNIVMTLDEHDKTGQGVKKIPDWPYMHRVLDDLLTHRWIFVLKSRQVMLTWIMCAYLLWVVLFQKGKKVAIQSKKEKDANAILERMKIIYDNMPSWKPHAEFTYCRVKVPENMSDIYGIPSGEAQIRSFTFSKIFSDEYGFQEDLEDTFKASKPAVDGGGQFIAVTTPPKEKNFAYKCLDSALFTEEYNGKIVKIHYSERPDRGPEWAKIAKIGMSKEAWDREYELMFTVEGVMRIYEPFIYNLHVNENLEWMPEMTLLRSWDFGFHRPAVSFSQIDSEDRFIDLYEMLGKDELLDTFAMKAIQETNRRFPDANIVDYCDVAGSQKSDKTKQSSIQMLCDYIHKYPIYRKCDPEEGHELIRKKMSTLVRGTPLYQVHPDCRNTIDGFQFGYLYKSDGKKIIANGINEDGIKEIDYYKHLQDCRRYKVQNIWSHKGDRLNTVQKMNARTSVPVSNPHVARLNARRK